MRNIVDSIDNSLSCLH